MKKTIFTTSILLTSLFFGVNTLVHASSFSDVPGSHEYAEAIEYVKSQGIVKGYGDGTYKPEQTITRAEFTKILLEAQFGSESQNCTDNYFSDVNESQWYAKYICFAKKEGIIQGYGDGTFGPNKPITFAEAAKIVVNTMIEQMEEGNEGVSWESPFVMKLYEHNILPTSLLEPVQGNEPFYDGKKFVTRGEMAEMIYRIKNKDINFENNDDIALIRDYYSNLKWDLQKSYNMRTDSDVSFSKFTEWYSNVEYANPFDFYKSSSNEYKFRVRLMEKHGKLSFYEVIMKVENNKLKTISSNEIDTILNTQFSDTLKAYVKLENNIEKLYLEKSGKKLLIDDINHSNPVFPTTDLYKSFSTFFFTPTGNYFKYNEDGWEGFRVNVYDIVNEKKVLDTTFPTLNGFTENEKYFYTCSGSGITEGFVKVYSLPDFNLVFEENPELIDECKYENGILTYKHGHNFDNLEEKAYYFE